MAPSKNKNQPLIFKGHDRIIFRRVLERSSLIKDLQKVPSAILKEIGEQFAVKFVWISFWNQNFNKC
jgi:hypothetical protein